MKTLGVVHFSIGVSDLARSERFYARLLGMEVVRRVSDLVFLKCGSDNLVLAKSSTIPAEPATSGGVHHAFRISPEEFDSAIQMLGEHDAAPFLIEDRDRGVFVGRSAYFHDPDGNVLEIHAGDDAGN